MRQTRRAMNTFAVFLVPGRCAVAASAYSTVGQIQFVGSASNKYTLDPLDEDTMLRVVNGVATTIGPEQARWIARVSRGYVKLATALATEIAKAGAQTVAELTASYDVARILERLILRLEHPGDSGQLVSRTPGLFHLLVRPERRETSTPEV